MPTTVYDAVSLGNAPTSKIRVLDLQAGLPGQPLRGALRICSLDGEGPLPYAALSWSWGLRATEVTNIELQAGPPIGVRASLRNALNQIRQPEGVVTLWIDAICINQDDTIEKNHQLPLMGKIYSRACKTIVWLGPEYQNSTLAMQQVRVIGDRYRQLGEIPPVTGLSEIPSADWVAIGALMARQWWTRMWIIQEVLKSSNTEVRCGDSLASIDDFVVLEEIRRSHARDIEGIRLIPSFPLASMLSAWAIYRDDANRDDCSLFSWMSITHRFGFTNAKDRIYALYSLTNPGTRKVIKVQYDEAKLSKALLNLKATIHFVKTETKCLLPLQFAWKRVTPGLPSWCPDWYTEQEGYVPFVFDDNGTGRTPFQAAGIYEHGNYFFSPRPSFLTNETAQGCVLKISGWLFDEIDFYDPFTEFNLSKETNIKKQNKGRAKRKRAFYTKFLHWQQVIERRIVNRQPNPYGSDDALRAAFWRTLIADRDQAWNGPPPDDFAEENLQPFLASGGTDAQNSMAFLVPALSRVMRRSFVITRRGYLGLAPMGCRQGDLVSILVGGSVPFILRPKTMTPSQMKCLNVRLLYSRLLQLCIGVRIDCEWVGESYIHGIMQGEWISRLREGDGGRVLAEILRFHVS